MGLPRLAQGYASEASLPWVRPPEGTQPQRGCLERCVMRQPRWSCGFILRFPQSATAHRRSVNTRTLGLNEVTPLGLSTG